ncbi:S8 family peptidase [Thalassotalea ganghwensis]
MKKFLVSSLILAFAPAVYAKQTKTISDVNSEQWVTIPKHSFKPSVNASQEKKRLAKGKSFESMLAVLDPNDEDYSIMYYWHSQEKSQWPSGAPYQTNLGSSEINAAVNASIQNRKLRIAVIDGGFNEHEDIPWKSDEGHNFFQAFGQVINSEWRSLDDPNNCETGHGNAVGGIIGAISNNGVGIAGVLDAELIPIRAFECNMARTVDISDAILYAAGDAVKNAPVIPKVDLINISSEVMNGECSHSVQEAINFAIDAGVQVYASAGNHNTEITSKCDGVILVGGTNQRRTKWESSNFGSAIDFMTAGYDVISYNFEGTTGWWEGTSFATPLAISVHGLALQHDLTINHDDVVNLIKTTAQPMSSAIEIAEEDCSGDRCGAGLVNAKRMMNYLIASFSDSPYKLRHALSSLNECDQSLYISDLGSPSRMCELYELVIDKSTSSLDEEIQLVRVAKGSPLLEENAQLVHISNQPIILLDNINTRDFDYGVKFCSTDSCNDALLYPVDASHVNKPSLCSQD